MLLMKTLCKGEKRVVHSDFLAAQEAYKVGGITCKNIEQEAESHEYGAATFEINNRVVKFRVGKITPTKVGQFVTLWKRGEDGIIAPYDVADPIDLFIVSACSKGHFGQFIFPKMVLFQKGILSKEGSGGKRAMRIYPPWDITNNSQAKKTQAWQLDYFFEILPSIDIGRMQKLVL